MSIETLGSCLRHALKTSTLTVDLCLITSFFPWNNHILCIAIVEWFEENFSLYDILWTKKCVTSILNSDDGGHRVPQKNKNSFLALLSRYSYWSCYRKHMSLINLTNWSKNSIQKYGFSKSYLEDSEKYWETVNHRLFLATHMIFEFIPETPAETLLMYVKRPKRTSRLSLETKVETSS